VLDRNGRAVLRQAAGRATGCRMDRKGRAVHRKAAGRAAMVELCSGKLQEGPQR